MPHWASVEVGITEEKPVRGTAGVVEEEPGLNPAAWRDVVLSNSTPQVARRCGCAAATSVVLKSSVFCEGLLGGSLGSWQSQEKQTPGDI